MQFHLMQFICSPQALAWTLEGTGVNKSRPGSCLHHVHSEIGLSESLLNGWPCVRGTLEETWGQLVCGQKI